MINRFANTEDSLRSLQLAQWRATWAEPRLADQANSSANSPGLAASSALVASALPPAFSAALPSSSGGGAYAISPARAMNAYREDHD